MKSASVWLALSHDVNYAVILHVESVLEDRIKTIYLTYCMGLCGNAVTACYCRSELCEVNASGLAIAFTEQGTTQYCIPEAEHCRNGRYAV